MVIGEGAGRGGARPRPDASGSGRGHGGRPATHAAGAPRRDDGRSDGARRFGGSRPAAPKR
jgi:hypothetical protein